MSGRHRHDTTATAIADTDSIYTERKGITVAKLHQVREEPSSISSPWLPDFTRDMEYPEGSISQSMDGATNRQGRQKHNWQNLTGV